MTNIESGGDNDLRRLLRGGFRAPEQFYNNIVRAVEAEIIKLERGAPYVSRALYGAELCSALTPSERKIAGQCIAYAVENELLPLVYVGRNSKNHSLYILK